MSFSNFLGTSYTFLELEDGNPDITTSILVHGDARGLVSSEDVIFASAVLQSVTIVGSPFQYWEVATPGDIHRSWPVDAVFYGITGTGVVVLAVAAFRKP